jgi:hypothetical protein
MAVRLHLDSGYFFSSRYFLCPCFISKYFFAHAPGYGVFLPIFALRLSLIPS